MTIVIRPGKYLIEKSRRRLLGVIAVVGTGGSVPKPVQDALNEFAREVAPGNTPKILGLEREAIQRAMKQMSGRILILIPGTGLRWADSSKSLAAALRGTGWNVPADKLSQM